MVKITKSNTWEKRTYMIDDIKKYFSNKMNMEATNIENLPSFKNRVYKIQVGDKYFILKMFQDGETSARRSKTEAEIYRTYSNRCGLIPQMYFEDFTYKDFESHVICREYVSGIGLKDNAASKLKHSNEDGFRRLIESSIAAANCIHELETSDSYGTMLSGYPGNYLEFVLHEKNFGFGLTYEQLCNSLSEIDRDSLLTNYIRGNNLTTPQKFTLCHNDFRGREILTNEDCTVNGIIDWEQAIIGDPLSDFGSHLFSLLNSVYDNTPLQEKIIHTFLEYLPKDLHMQSLPFYLAERAILTSIVYYLEYNPKKFEWAMKFAENMLSNKVQNENDLINLIKV